MMSRIPNWFSVLAVALAALALTAVSAHAQTEGTKTPVPHNQTVSANPFGMLFEWYNGGQPSIDRAGSGWGAPALKSQWKLMPNATPFQQQVQKVLQGELAVNDVKLQFNPFLGEGSFVNAWRTHMQEALTGAATFDELCSRTEKDVNTLIQEGVSRLGG